MKSGDGTTREVDNPVQRLRLLIQSYYELMEDGRIQDIGILEMYDFRELCNTHYSELEKEEREKANKVKGSWQTPRVRDIMLERALALRNYGQQKD